MLCDHLIDEQLLLSVENLICDTTGGGWHGSSPPGFLDRFSGEERKMKEKSTRQQRFVYLAKETLRFDGKRYPYTLLPRECPLEH